ncbi:MAG: hypothetical protein WA021_05740 [Minisyncoccia bacterium]
MPSQRKKVHDIKRAPSRAKAQKEMEPLFSEKSARPQLRLRTRRRRQKMLVVSAAFFTAFAILGSLAGASHLQSMAIRDISVSGAEKISPDSLVAFVGAGLRNEGFQLFSRENMFIYPRREIESTLSTEFPRIKDVSLSRPSMLAQAVVVAVEERDAYATWCSGNTCYLFDSAGFIFAEAAGENTAVPYIFEGGLANDYAPIGQWFLRGRIIEAVALLDMLGKAGFSPERFIIDTEKDFSVRLKNGPILLLSFETDHDTIMRNLDTALETDSLRDRLSELEYIDLRFGNRVYYK